MTPREAILKPITRGGNAIGSRTYYVQPELADAILKTFADAGFVIVRREVADQAAAHLTDFATSAAMGARLAGPRPDVEGVRNDLRAAIEGKL